jgi:putative membrane protein
MRMSTILSAATAVAIAALTLPALAAEEAQSFVDKAALGGRFEVESGQLAIKTSKDPDVKKFADMMISEHGKANAELEALAREQGLTVPTRLDDEHAARLQELQQAGAQFDMPYLKAQLDGLQQAVRMFEDYAGNGDNDALQNFAVTTLPTLKMHLDMIEQLGDRVGAIKQ